jgi:hypothetical protein
VEDLESVEYSPSLSEGHGWRAGRWDYPQRARGRGLTAALMALAAVPVCFPNGCLSTP